MTFSYDLDYQDEGMLEQLGLGWAPHAYVRDARINLPCYPRQTETPEEEAAKT